MKVLIMFSLLKSADTPEMAVGTSLPIKKNRILRRGWTGEGGGGSGNVKTNASTPGKPQNLVA
jgi:hypothetical protein